MKKQNKNLRPRSTDGLTLMPISKYQLYTVFFYCQYFTTDTSLSHSFTLSHFSFYLHFFLLSPLLIYSSCFFCFFSLFLSIFPSISPASFLFPSPSMFFFFLLVLTFFPFLSFYHILSFIPSLFFTFFPLLFLRSLLVPSSNSIYLHHSICLSSSISRLNLTVENINNKEQIISYYLDFK